MRQSGRYGLSLIEILLAMTILLGAISVLGELARQGRRNAQATVKETQAALIAESMMAEIVTGIASRAPVDGVKILDSPGWLYSLAVEPATVEGLETLRLTVVEDLPEEKRPTLVELVRWVVVAEEGEQSERESSQPVPGESRQTNALTALGDQ